jgi:hypothetical protein
LLIHGRKGKEGNGGAGLNHQDAMEAQRGMKELLVKFKVKNEAIRQQYYFVSIVS